MVYAGAMPSDLPEPGRRGLRATLRTRPAQLVLLALLLGATVLGAASVGAFEVSPGQVLAVVASKLGLELPWAFERTHERVVWIVRLPRLLLGVAVGAALGVAGAALQGMFRNPLADPGLVGISSGAALGAVLAIYLGAVVFEPLVAVPPELVLPLAAFAGALLVTALVFRLATRAGHTSVATMLLAGIAINAAVGALIGFVSYLSGAQQLRALVLWSLGSLGGATWTVVAVCMPLVVVCALWLGTRARALDALLLGEREARHLGVDVSALQRTIVVLSALCVGAAVAFSGLIGFVGLVAPHMVRLAFGPGHRMVLPGAALLGATLVVGADAVARTVLAPAELPIGILTALVGAPFFLAMLLARRSREML